GSGTIFEDQNFNRDVNSDLLLNFLKNNYKNMNFGLTLGNNMFQTYYQRLFVQGDGLTVPDFYHISNTQGTTVRGMTAMKRTAAFFGDLKWDYKSILFLDITARNEWSTTLPAKNNSFLYPSVSAGLVFTDLLKMQNNKILPYGKLRASWARVGNDAP